MIRFIFNCLCEYNLYWIIRWFYSTNHKDIGIIYIVYGVFIGFLGRIFSWMLRFEIITSRNNFIYNNHYFNVLTTAHALVMIFFFLMPSLISRFRNILMPLYCGVPDIAFPRINNLSYWLMFPAILILLLRAMIEGGVGTG